MGHAPPVAQDPAPPLDHAAMGHGTPMPESQPREPIPVVTEADRIAAFPDVAGHGAHDQTVHSYWLLDRLESWDADEGRGIGWEALAWVGTDLNRAWLRSEGEQVDVDTESAEVEVLYGRSVDRWWDVVAGVRHDFGEGPSQTFAAIGVMGLAPQKFEVEATAYFGQSGQTAARVEAEYDTLLTNRLILQWQAEAEFHGKDDARRGIGSGLSTVEAGLRLRYEFTRQFAPYLGVVWERGYGGTAGFRRAAGEDVEETKVVVGVRVWF
ncbi:copper resistance protein B [Lysobacter koreensis]